MALFGGIKKVLPKVAQAAGNAVPKGKSPLSGLMGKLTTAAAKSAAASSGKTKSIVGGVIANAAKKGITGALGGFGGKPTVRLKNGGVAKKAGKAMMNKSPDARGRAMTSTAMQKGGMAKKKKC